MAQKRSRTAIVSGGLEPVEDRGRNGHSVFANALLNALQENGEVLDGQSLFQLVSRPVVLEADQTPRYSDIRKAGHEGGAFLFRPSRPAPAGAAKPADGKKLARLPPVKQPGAGKTPRALQRQPFWQDRAGFKDCEYCPEMVVLPAGRFAMGGANRWQGPAHPVTIGQPFAVSRFEVSFAEWDLCVAAGRCTPLADDKGWGRGSRPVIYVSHRQTAQFHGWLAAMSGRPYRLPSEAEWEYAARAGSTSARYWGEAIGANNANCHQCGAGGEQTLPVGQYPPNRFGLHDMLGNVHEWVADCYLPSYRGAPADGTARLDGKCTERIARGGSWSTAYQAVTASYRRNTLAQRADQYTGFRVARAIDPDDLSEWRRLAESGDRVAQHHFATLLVRGQKQESAALWFRKAAEQGWTAAQFELGRLAGVTPEEASRWLEMAAQAGHAGARLALAELLAADDPRSAYMWLELAIAAAPDGDVLRAARARKMALAKTMRLPDIAEAQKRARARGSAKGQ